mgnify:CR=1 FL=1
MGDTGDDYKAYKDYKKELKIVHGIDCPGCKIKEPKRTPTKLLPQQKCKVCGYKDPRPRRIYG